MCSHISHATRDLTPSIWKINTPEYLRRQLSSFYTAAQSLPEEHHLDQGIQSIAIEKATMISSVWVGESRQSGYSFDQHVPPANQRPNGLDLQNQQAVGITWTWVWNFGISWVIMTTYAMIIWNVAHKTGKWVTYSDMTCKKVNGGKDLNNTRVRQNEGRTEIYVDT